MLEIVVYAWAVMYQPGPANMLGPPLFAGPLTDKAWRAFLLLRSVSVVAMLYSVFY